MTLFDSVLIVLVGMWPVIILLSTLICVVAYRWTKSRAVVATIVTVALILLTPSLVYFWVRMLNG